MMALSQIAHFGRAGLLAYCLVGMAGLPAQATDYSLGPLSISEPWARATPKGATTGAAYLAVTNHGTEPDRLSCVSSDASAQCQIHSMTMNNNVMQMRPVEGGLEIAPGKTVMLQPGGLHVMLLDLKHPLEAGKTLQLSLKFEQAGTLTVDCPIAGIGAAAPGVPAGGGSMMMGNHPGGGMQMNKP